MQTSQQKAGMAGGYKRTLTGKIIDQELEDELRSGFLDSQADFLGDEVYDYSFLDHTEDEMGDLSLMDYPDFDFDDYDYGQSEQYELAEKLSADPWGSWDSGLDFIDVDSILDPLDGGIGFLHYFMEGVAPVNIKHQNAYWVVTKYTCLSASILGGLFSNQFFNDPKSILIGIFSRDLEDQLKRFGIGFKIFGGITEEGWKTYKEKYANEEGIAA